MEAIKWLDGHLSYHILRQLGAEKRWSHLRNYCHHPACHVTLCLCFFWIPYGDDILFTICGMDWAKVILETKQWDHENPSAFWLLNDHIIAAQDQ